MLAIFESISEKYLNNENQISASTILLFEQKKNQFYQKFADWT